jgi:predicted  nucleic acid-binding Zn-ribbon protein
MTNHVDNLVLELLRAIRADIADLKRELMNNSVQIADLGQQVFGLSMAVYGGRNDLEEAKRRIDRLEQRLETA